MKYVVLVDQYGQKWKIDESDPLWEEASKTVEEAEGQPVLWSLEKLSQNKGWGWWTVYMGLDELEAKLGQMMASPAHGPLFSPDTDYTVSQIKELLQRFGAYLGTLHRLEGLVTAQVHGIKEGYKTALDVAVSKQDSKATVTERQGQALNSSDLLKETRKMQINQEAIVTLIHGWVKAYESAYNTMSRIGGMEQSEMAVYSSNAMS